jgi:aspartate ammonia-lyase
MNKGLLNIGYVDKATKLQLASISLVNKAILKVIDDGRAEYQLQMEETGDGVVLRVLSAGAGSSIIGVNELIAELQKRLF